MKNSFTISHLSDLHYSIPSLNFKDCFNKRVLGYLNEVFKRKNYSLDKEREKILQKLAKTATDLFCITGDFSTLSYAVEFKKAQEQIYNILSKKKIITISGNHDRYLKSVTKQEKFENYFKETTPFSWSKRKQKSIHSVTIFNKFLLVFFDMSVPQIWFSSRGRLSSNFFEEYYQLIRKKSNCSKIKIGFGHYPLLLPNNQKNPFLRRLKNYKKLSKLLLEDSFFAYCHGHIHQSWKSKIQIKDKSIWDINSAGIVVNKDSKNRCYHQITLYKEGKVDISQIFV